MIAFFHTILYVPIYNLLIFFVGILPRGDVGLALVCVVVFIRLLILPLSLSMIHTQKAMQLLSPEIKKIQEKYKNDKETLAKETFALYKKYKINPFASILTLLIQLPILLTLYFIVRAKGLYHVDTSLLYHFVHVPALISPLFLGYFVLSSPNIILALLAGISQFAYAYFGITVPPKQPESPQKKGTSKEATPANMQEEFGRAMTMQMRYMLPVLYAFIGYTSGAIALYFITGNIVMLLQLVIAHFTKRKYPANDIAHV
jgi:YidC/Oxa1 family membrane protein insertase